MKKNNAVKPITQFEVEGHGDLSTDTLPKCVSACLDVLSGLEDGKLLKRAALASRIKRAIGTIDSYTCHPALSDFKFTHRNIAYFGNKNTVSQAKIHFAL